MGSVSYRKVGSRWHIRFREQGNEKIKSFDGSLPEYAIKRKSRWFEQEWDRGYFHPFRERQEETDLSSAIERYCASKQRRGDWTQKTAKISKERLNQAGEFIGFDRNFSDLQLEDFQAWINSLDGSPYTKKSYRSTLNTFLKWCHERRYTPRLLQVKIPDDDRQQISGIRPAHFLSLSDLHTLLDSYSQLSHEHQQPPAADSGNPNAQTIRDAWELMFWQLLTADDLLSLHLEHLSDDRKRLTLKDPSGQDITVPLVPPARKIIERYSESNAASNKLLFPVNQTNQLTQPFNNAFNIAFPDRTADLDQLRRGGIVHYLQRGKPIQYISRLARHSSIEKTVRQYKSYIPDITNEVFEDIRGEIDVGVQGDSGQQ